MPNPSRPESLRLLTGYKLAKGTLQLLSSLTLASVLVLHGEGTIEWLHGVAQMLAEHAAPHWAVQLALGLLGGATVHRAWIAVIALAADGCLTVLEGWSLRRGHAWGEWLVVVTSGLPVPFELYELASHPHLGRAVVLLGNVMLVAYLVRRRLR